MKSYLISTVTDFIDAPIALVYSIVTDNRNFQWREEVKNIELLENGFIEYYKAGGHTLFSNIRKIENEYYAAKRPTAPARPAPAAAPAPPPRPAPPPHWRMTAGDRPSRSGETPRTTRPLPRKTAAGACELGRRPR